MEARFKNYAALLVNNIEGGYYNPSRHNTANMGASGETMFGIDRANGGSDIKDSEAGRKFWALIDANSSSWPWNYKGGSLQDELLNLAAQMMYSRYTRYSANYLTAAAQALIKKSPRLELHFFYACWNGPGWFQTFAKAFNSAVNNGIKDVSKLEEVAINSRLNSTSSNIKKGGQIMKSKIWPGLSSGGGWLWWLLAATAGIYFLTKKS